MHNNSNKSPEPQPRLIPLYLRDAQVTENDVRDDGAGAVDARRAEAVKALHTLWRQWRADCSAISCLPVGDYHGEALRQLHRHWVAELGAPPWFNRALQDFFDRAGRIIFASPNPVTAMRVLWGGRRRGRSAEANAERDRNLTEAVQDQIDAGVSIEKAIGAVAERVGMRRDTLHKIYYNKCLEVRAARELRTLWDAEQ
jgi:hypothetical protein